MIIKLNFKGEKIMGCRIPKNVREKFDLKTWNDLVVLSSDFATILIKSQDLKKMVSHFENIIEQTKSIK